MCSPRLLACGHIFANLTSSLVGDGFTKNKVDRTQYLLKTANSTVWLRFTPISNARNFHTLDTVNAIGSSELSMAHDLRRRGKSDTETEPSYLRFGNPPFMRQAKNAHYRKRLVALANEIEARASC